MTKALHLTLAALVIGSFSTLGAQAGTLHPAGSIAQIVPSSIVNTSPVEEDGAKLNLVGRSYGGNLRTGPGTQYDKAGSLKEGTWVTILIDSGVQFDGYTWFEVVTDDGTRGFHWGGIMCANGAPLNGTYDVCKN